MRLSLESYLCWGLAVGPPSFAALFYFHVYWYVSILRIGRVGYALREGGHLLGFKLWLVLKFYEKLGDFLESTDFYLAVYSPFFYFLRWDEFFAGLTMQKAVYNWRLKAITYKCDFEEIGGEAQAIYNRLLSRWETGFFYVWVGCLTTFKLLVKFFYMSFTFFFLLACYGARVVALSNASGLYAYDVGRYLAVYFRQGLLNIIAYDALYRVWLLLGRFRHELIFWAHNAPYTFFFSSLIAAANAIWFSLFSFYNWTVFKRGRGVNNASAGVRFFAKYKSQMPISKKALLSLASVILVERTFLLWLRWLVARRRALLSLSCSQLGKFLYKCKSLPNLLSFFFYGMGLWSTEVYCAVVIVWARSLHFFYRGAKLAAQIVFASLFIIGAVYYWYEASYFLGWPKVAMLLYSTGSHISIILREEWIFNWLWGAGDELWGPRHVSELRLSLGDVFESEIYEGKSSTRNYIQHVIGEDIPAIKAFWRELKAGFDIWTFDRFKMRDKLYQFWVYGISFHLSDYAALWWAYFSSFLWLKVYPTINPFFFLEDSMLYSFFFLGQVAFAAVKSGYYCLYLLPLYVIPHYIMQQAPELIHMGLGFGYALGWAGHDGLALISLAKLGLLKLSLVALNWVATLLIAVGGLCNGQENVTIALWLTKSSASFAWLEAGLGPLIGRATGVPCSASLAHYNASEFGQIYLDKLFANFRISRFNVSMGSFNFTEECELSNMLVDGEKYCWVDEPEAHESGDVIDHVRTKSATLYRKDWLLFSYNHGVLSGIYSGVAIEGRPSSHFLASLITPVQARLLRHYFVFIYLATFLCFSCVANKWGRRLPNLSYLWGKDNMDRHYQGCVAQKVVYAEHSCLKLAQEELRTNGVLEDDSDEGGNYFVKGPLEGSYGFNKRLGDHWFMPRGNFHLMNCNTDRLPSGKLWEEFYELRSGLVEDEYQHKGLNVSDLVLSHFNLVDWVLFGNKSPNWLLNKNYATLLMQRQECGAYVLKPELAFWSAQFYWVAILPFIYFTFAFGDKFVLFYQKVSLIFYLSLFLENCNFIYEFNKEYVQFFHSYSGVDFGPFSKKMYKANEADFSYAIWNAGFLDYLLDYKDITVWERCMPIGKAVKAQSEGLAFVWAGQRLILIVLLIPLATRAHKLFFLEGEAGLPERYAMSQYVLNHYRFHLKKYLKGLWP